MIQSYDVIIIGAGSIGVPAALAMAREKMRVLVIDALPSQGQGSNKAAIGGMRATHSDPSKLIICKRSLEIISSWKETFGHDIEWHSGGYCFVAYREEEELILKNLLKEQHAHGLKIDWHDKEAVLSIAPDLNPANLRGATFSPNDGHCSTLLANHAFYDQAKTYGAEFRFNEKVIGIDTNAGRVTGVRTDKRTYKTACVVNAAGAYATEVGTLVGLNLPVLPDSHEAGITEPVAQFLGPMIVDIKPAPGSSNCYFYQLRSGQIIFCISPEPEISGYERGESSLFLPMAAKRMVWLMPRLAGIRVRRTWCGLYPSTPDGSPLVGWHNSLDGYLIAAGMCGQGFMLGLGLGEMLTRMIMRNETADDIEVITDLSPFRKFKSQEALK